MSKFFVAATALALALTSPAFAQGAPAAQPNATASYTTADTTIGTLLADPAAKAVLDKRIPGLSDNPSISMASGMTLRQIQPMAGDKVTTQMLDAVDADLKLIKPTAK